MRNREAHEMIVDMSNSTRRLLALTLTVTWFCVGSQGAAASVRDCDAHTANLTITSARNMTCKAARTDLGRALSECCSAKFRTPGGFTCTTTKSFTGRCVKGRKAYRFKGSE